MKPLFESLDELADGMHVLAPWYTTDPGSIQHAEAIVVTEQQGMFTNCVTGVLNSRQESRNTQHCFCIFL